MLVQQLLLLAALLHTQAAGVCGAVGVTPADQHSWCCTLLPLTEVLVWVVLETTVAELFSAAWQHVAIAMCA